MIQRQTTPFYHSYLHKWRFFYFTNEQSFFVFDKQVTKTAHRALTLALLIWCFGGIAACSTRSSAPKSNTDTPRQSGADNALPQKEAISPEAVSREAAQPSPVAPQPNLKVMAVGRALELGNLDEAKSLAAHLDTSAPALLVTAKVSEATGDYETAIRIYHQMTDLEPLFENRRIEALADALAAAKRSREAAGQLDILLTRYPHDEGERYRLLKKKADWLTKTAPDEAIDALTLALPLTRTPKQKDDVELALGALYFSTERPKEARKLVQKLALDANSGGVMTGAMNLLEKYKIVPNWSGQQHLARARKLLEYRAFDAAMASLDRAKGSASPEEIRWTKANILFKKRRHYKEAGEALDAIAKGGGIYADEARFLAARALSRQDRDNEAIKAYRAFANKTKRVGRGNHARFLAARLEFYLGRHKQTLGALELLVGNGKQKKINKLSDPEDRREAHFLAGLSAILLSRPTQAIPHLDAASDGTNHEEVLKRNAYWRAVAVSMKKKGGAEKPFWDICEKDPTDWYARMSALRLSKMKKDLGTCTLAQSPSPFSPGGDENNTNTPLAPSISELTDISPLAGLYAAAGLFKDAAKQLRDVEKEGIIKRPPTSWIQHYVSLDAPHFAIRKAARELEWPPTAENLDMARAAYPTPYATLVDETESKHHLPRLLLYAIARKESLFDPHAVSWVGAMGMMQMMPRTYEANRKRAGLPPLKDGQLPGPVESIKAAGEEFAQLFEEFDDSLPLAIMAYNGGVAAVARWVSRSGDLPLDVFVEKVGFTQTRNYVRRVTQNLVRYRLLSGQPAPVLPETVKRPTTAKQD